MNFADSAFVVFFALTFAVYWALRAVRWQNLWLLAVSWVFYGWVHPWFVGLLAFSIVLDHGVAQGLTRRPDLKRPLLALSLVGNLGMLGAFKYLDFFAGQVAAVLSWTGMAQGPLLGWLLPVGISFYTFQSLSYTLDVARGTVKARDSIVDVALYVSFFPQLVAGPIETASHLLPQLEAERRFDLERVASGLSLAMWGAFKKVCLADPLGVWVGQIDQLASPSYTLELAATIAFGTQILADFSGYTDIARGVARMLGIDLVRNFDHPYYATSTPAFWARWHMSLTNWVRSYVFGPLSRWGAPGPMRVARATMLTFLVIGVWHGPTWNYLLLGLFHGVASLLYVFGGPLVPKAVKALPVATVGAVALHHLAVLLPSGVLFRATDLWRLGSTLAGPWMAGPEEGVVLAYLTVFALTLALPIELAWMVRPLWDKHVANTPWVWPARTTLWTALGLCVYTFARSAPDDFVYFQF